MPKFFQNHAGSSAKIWSSVSVLTLVQSRFELILLLWKSGVWIEPQSIFVARCFRLSFIFPYLILHRLIWSIKCLFLVFVLDSLCKPINNNTLFQNLNFPAARMKVLKLPWNHLKGVARHLYILYTVGNAWVVRSSKPMQRERFAIEFRVCLDFLKVLRFSFLVPR